MRLVLVTTTVAALGFVPMAMAQGAVAEVQRSQATIVVGGLVTPTALVLLILPILYPRYRTASTPQAQRSKVKPRGLLEHALERTIRISIFGVALGWSRRGTCS